MIGFISLVLCQMSSVDANQPDDQVRNGKALYIEHKCQICHGYNGCAPVGDGYPIIAGQNPTYFVRQVLDIGEGVRDNGQSKLMRPMVKPLTRSDVDTIALYLSTQSCG